MEIRLQTEDVLTCGIPRTDTIVAKEMVFWTLGDCFGDAVLFRCVQITP